MVAFISESQDEKEKDNANKLVVCIIKDNNLQVKNQIDGNFYFV